MSAMTPEKEAKWLAWRKTGATASRIAASATGQYGGLLGAVADLQGLDLPEADESVEADRKRGHDWEPKIADGVHAFETNKWVFGEEQWCQRRDNARHLATIDGMLGPAPECTLADMLAILEMKSIRVGIPWNMAYWLHQIQWQLHVTGFDLAYLAIVTVNHDGSFGGFSPRWVQRNDAVIVKLIDLSDLMWHHVDNGTLPEPDNASCEEIVKHLTRIADKKLDAVDCNDMADDIGRSCDITDASKSVDDEQKQIKSRLRMRLGQATKGSIEGFNISYSAPSMALTTQAEKDIIELHPQFAKTITILDKDAIKAAKFDTKPFKEAIGARRLLVTRKKISK